MTDLALAKRLGEQALALCQIDSPIGQEKALADQIEGWALRLFPREHIFRLSHSLVLGNLQDARPTVALVGHLDTVPAASEPNPARLEGDRLFGLGSADMKGGLAVMMELAGQLALPTLPHNLVFILYEREEGPYDESGLGPLFEAKPELRKVALGIAMEPTDNTVQVGCVGSLHVNARFAGRSAHSARPWQGENAIHKAGNFLAQLNALPRREVSLEGFTFYEVLSATMASGGRARNVVPETFELNLNYRFAPGKSVEEAQRDVAALVDGRAELTFLDSAPSGRVCADNPLFKKLLVSTGAPAQAKQAWTDVARFAAQGIDAVNFGPGETAQAHQKNESSSVSAMAQAYQMLAAFLTAA